MENIAVDPSTLSILMVLASKTGLGSSTISDAAIQVNTKLHEFEFDSVFESSTLVDLTYLPLVSDLIDKPPALESHIRKCASSFTRCLRLINFSFHCPPFVEF